MKVNAGSSGMMFEVVGGNCIIVEFRGEADEGSSQVQAREDALYDGV